MVIVRCFGFVMVWYIMVNLCIEYSLFILLLGCEGEKVWSRSVLYLC